ncbi:MAG TPA: hypothetical protein VHU77_03180 [Candidatus Limnocylindria bacterium]|jgi:hypothetical protein|nr:hypothetical protein [Candidatus Limnocylindria bacterium]
MHAQSLAPARLAIAVAGGALALLVSVGTTLAAPETICGRVDAVSADEATVDGRTVPLDGLDAQAVGALQLAFNGNLDACVDVDSTGATVNQAFAVSVSADLCGHVRPAGGSDVMVDRVTIPPVLLDAETYDAVKFAMSINGSACLKIDVTGSGGVSTVDVELNEEVCGTVTGETRNTIELNGHDFDLADNVADYDNPQLGDGVCLVVSSAAGGGVEVIARTDEHDPDSGTGGDGDVPDTALRNASGLPVVGGWILVLLATALFAARRTSAGQRG